jgi:hypothetical protein
VHDPARSGKCCIIFKSSGSNSAVECDLAKVEVAGSNPVSRSRFHAGLRKADPFLRTCFRPIGLVMNLACAVLAILSRCR